MISILLVGCVGLYLVYRIFIEPYRYWTKRNIEQGRPLPILGHNWGPFLRLCSFAEMIQGLYRINQQLPYVGAYQFFLPILVVRDPKLIKTITVKDFDHFVDHRPIVPADGDPMWSKNLFALNGKRWRDLRPTLTSSFTGSKMKFMFGLITEVCQKTIGHLSDKASPTVNVEMKDICQRYGNDVIASTAFGIRVDSMETPQNEFYMHGIDATDFTSLTKSLKFLGFLLMPTIFSLLKMKLFSTKVRTFFTRIISDSIRQREQKNIIRPDMIHLLLDTRRKTKDRVDRPRSGQAKLHKSVDLPRGKEKQISDEDIAAQALVFFFAGFETASTVLCFTLYELALNPEIQQRLIDEIDNLCKNGAETLTYEALQSMKFLDMVISESLRKWPPDAVLDRICTKPYTLVAPNKCGLPPLRLKPNDAIWIPVYAIHRDPQYYADPDVFDPERFSDNRKHLIKPYTYLPFGSGPRNCIGDRFALMQVKSFLFYLLREFYVVVNSNTDIPLKLSKSAIISTAENGFQLSLTKRSEYKNDL